MGYKILLVDMDGVVWRGSKPLNDNVDALKRLADAGFLEVFFTNNSSRTRLEYLMRLRRLGISATIKNVLTSGTLAAEYLKATGLREVFVVGEYGLVEELAAKGIHVVVDPDRVDAVVVGIDRFLTYDKLRRATYYIRGGARFIATNADATYPTESGEDPGAGAIVAAISTASGRKPDFIAGKPNTWIIDYLSKTLGASKREILVIGDRLDTDIELGNRANVDTVLVLTGVTKPGDPRINEYKPRFVVNSLKEILEPLL